MCMPQLIQRDEPELCLEEYDHCITALSFKAGLKRPRIPTSWQSSPMDCLLLEHGMDLVTYF